MVLQAINKRSSGDTKYQQYVDKRTNVTTTLGLNGNPIKVGSAEAYTVLKTVWNVLLFLENKNRQQCYVSHLSVKHKRKHMKFGEVIGMSETCT